MSKVYRKLIIANSFGEIAIKLCAAWRIPSDHLIHFSTQVLSPSDIMQWEKEALTWSPKVWDLNPVVSCLTLSKFFKLPILQCLYLSNKGYTYLTRSLKGSTQ